ncbi:hypothetical protein KC669_00920 [Candidatus Dojkabacteria bacterium]|uniref:Uncharacterized protein n=1 Tax=Candidatus Dojkabacteria bacterium TaxID=2099670 RepID=A0A955L9M4_9BACT|nr:hypothetical protein [Candidatus Dojkabacteria bacterium]
MINTIFNLIIKISSPLINFFYSPVKEYSTLKNKIKFDLKYYSNIILNYGFDNETINKVTDIFRKHAVNLELIYMNIPSRKLLSKYRMIEQHSNVIEASTNLMGLSNSAGRDKDGFYRVEERVEKIKSLLNLN